MITGALAWPLFVKWGKIKLDKKEIALGLPHVFCVGCVSHSKSAWQALLRFNNQFWISDMRRLPSTSPCSCSPRCALPAETARSPGFTIIELTLAVGLLALIAVSMLSALLATSKANTAMRERDQAIWAIRSQLEQIIAHPDFSSVTSTFNDMEFPIGNLEGTNGPDSLPGHVTVDTVEPNLLRVTVRAEWVDTSGGDSLEVSTLIADPDVTISY